MQPASRIARALAAALVAVLVGCGIALAGTSGAHAAPSRVTQDTRAVPEPHAVTTHAQRVTVVASRSVDGPRHDGGTGPVAVLGTASGAAPTDVVLLTAGPRAPPRPHHVAPTSARAPPA